MLNEHERNGENVIRIGRKGRRRIAIGDGEPVEIDVVGVWEQWLEVDRSFRGEDGTVPSDAAMGLNQAAHKFVMEVTGCTDLTLAEALEFLKVMSEETKKLSDFFVVKSPGEPSSRESTAVVYSE